MPLMLHPHLKRGLDVDEFVPEPADLIEDLPLQSAGLREQAAKRRRIERIASLYLQGKRPVILSAGLRGPFNYGWKNPWVEAKAATGKQGRKSKSATARRIGRCTRSTTQQDAGTQSVASPEASRAAGDDLESHGQSCTLEAVETFPGTALSSERHPNSGATEILNADTAQNVKTKSPLTNPFWLRKPDSMAATKVHRASSVTTEASPSRSRGGCKSTIEMELCLAPPKAPIRSHTSQISEEAPDDVTLTSSAPMIISSPAFSKATTETLRATPLVSEVGTHTHIMAHPHSSEGTKGQVIEPMMQVPFTQRFLSLRKKQCKSPTGNSKTTGDNGGEDSSTMAPIATSKPLQAQEPCQAVGTDVVTSLEPNPSIGSEHRKVSQTKWTIRNAPRSKPRAVNFNSSPLIKSAAPKPKNDRSRRSLSTGAASLSPGNSISQYVNQGKVASASQASEEDQDQPGYAKSEQRNYGRRDSEYSTQAAMLLAQIEFHESTFPQSSLPQSRPWSQYQDNTPSRIAPEPSPAITPFSAFNSHLEPPIAATSVLRGLPMSTQDLFAAASPFALSTVKKTSKIDVPLRNNLRTTAIPRNGLASTHGQTPESANSAVGRSRLSDKSMGIPPLSPTVGRGSSGHVKLPQLDFRTSLDDYGYPGSITFADRVLGNLTDT